MSLSSEDVLFVGRGPGVVSWYRTGMPAFYLGCDWVGMVGAPSDLRVVTSLKRGGHGVPDLASYKIVVLQQVRGAEWAAEIRRLQAEGILVLYEVDDYLHGVRKIPSHRAREAYTPSKLREYELCMSVCDGVICSTEWLAKRYRRHNPHTYVCRNGIESKRYAALHPPARTVLNIGWAGGEGHLEAVKQWLPAIETMLDEFPHARFISIGLPVADLLRRPKQTLALPFISIENFPAALCNFDLAIAPAGKSNFYAAKSDLRFLETGALGIPLVADPFVYGSIQDGLTGLLAYTPYEAEVALRTLILNPQLREAISRAAREYVLAERSIESGIEQWERVFIDVYDRVHGHSKSVSATG